MVRGQPDRRFADEHDLLTIVKVRLLKTGIAVTSLPKVLRWSIRALGQSLRGLAVMAGSPCLAHSPGLGGEALPRILGFPRQRRNYRRHRARFRVPPDAVVSIISLIHATLAETDVCGQQTVRDRDFS
jgi:hypothetical protein